MQGRGIASILILLYSTKTVFKKRSTPFRYGIKRLLFSLDRSVFQLRHCARVEYLIILFWFPSGSSYRQIAVCTVLRNIT